MTKARGPLGKTLHPHEAKQIREKIQARGKARGIRRGKPADIQPELSPSLDVAGEETSPLPLHPNCRCRISELSDGRMFWSTALDPCQDCHERAMMFNSKQNIRAIEPEGFDAKQTPEYVGPLEEAPMAGPLRTALKERMKYAKVRQSDPFAESVGPGA